MSGSSLDGVDLALCRFSYEGTQWNFIVEATSTYSYSAEWTQMLKKAPQLPTKDLFALNSKYSQYLGERIVDFISTFRLQPNYIASHGHTVFHEPAQGFSYQMGDGALLAQITKVATISDFRNKDIIHGGQGAPLVPIGDELLFGDYKACINVGGIANISYREGHDRIGYDICGANQLLNALSEKIYLPFDHEGYIASTGRVIPELLGFLNQNEFFEKTYPKSLSNQFVQQYLVSPLLDYNAEIPDKMATAVEHIAMQVAATLDKLSPGNVLVTGGGAKNRFLIKALARLTPHKLVIPIEELIDFKEAIVFAFMGALHVNESINCLASVTGARQDSVCGRIDLP